MELRKSRRVWSLRTKRKTRRRTKRRNRKRMKKLLRISKREMMKIKLLAKMKLVNQRIQSKKTRQLQQKWRKKKMLLMIGKTLILMILHPRLQRRMLSQALHPGKLLDKMRKTMMKRMSIKLKNRKIKSNLSKLLKNKAKKRKRMLVVMFSAMLQTPKVHRLQLGNKDLLNSRQNKKLRNKK